MSTDLKIHHRYINHVEEKHPTLLSKGVILNQTILLGSRHHKITSQTEVGETITTK